MAGVCDELTHLGFTGLPSLQGAVDVAEQAVEGSTDLPDLGAGVGVCRRHPLRESHLASVQGEGGDPVGGCRDATERTQGDPDQHNAGQCRQDEPSAGDRQLDDGELDHGGVDACRRQPGDEHVAVGGAGRQRPVAVTVDGHGVWLFVHRQPGHTAQ